MKNSNISILNPLVSIIVPVYNAEETIDRCIKSILKQTLDNFEVILIDDGSQDNSGRICDEYADKDSRFFVIHKENGGVSAARQDGIDFARGDYVIHVDPDDWIEPTMLEELYSKAVIDDADMVICDFYENILSKQRYHKQEPSSLKAQTVLCELFQQLHGSCCNKFVKRICYSNFNIKFPLGVYYCEDLYVIASIVKNNIKIAYLPKAFYHYVQQNDKQTLVRYYDEDTYHHDIKLKNLFLNLVSGDANLVRIVDNKFTCSLVFRAYKNGYKYYTSDLFKQRFFSYRNTIKIHLKDSQKWFVYFSCIGFYHFARTIAYFLERVKQNLRR